MRTELLVLVPMAVVQCVAVAVVDVVDMVAMWNRFMAATGPVNVLVIVVHYVFGWNALIPVVAVSAVSVAVVDVVNVVAVWNGFMATIGPVLMGVLLMFCACEAHGYFLRFERGRQRRSRCGGCGRQRSST